MIYERIDKAIWKYCWEMQTANTCPRVRRYGKRISESSWQITKKSVVFSAPWVKRDRLGGHKSPETRFRTGGTQVTHPCPSLGFLTSFRGTSPGNSAINLQTRHRSSLDEAVYRLGRRDIERGSISRAATNYAQRKILKKILLII